MFSVACQARKEIHERYSSKDFKIISISSDPDRKNYLKVMIKQNMAWTNTFNVADLINSYGGSPPIPRTYLIDNIYVGWKFNLLKTKSLCCI